MSRSRPPRLPEFVTDDGGSSSGESDRPPQRPVRPSLPSGRPNPWVMLGLLAVVLGVGYLGYLWFFKRIVVGADEVMVLVRKDGSRSLPDGQIIIPKEPDPSDTAAFAQWQKEYGDVNGIKEEVFLPGVYFRFSPFDYERIIVRVADADTKRGIRPQDDDDDDDRNVESNARIPQRKVGVVIRKFGAPLDAGQILADPARNQRGPLPKILEPGFHREFANPYAYQIKQFDAVTVDSGNRAVVTIMASSAPKSVPAADRNQYLVPAGQVGVQPALENEGFLQFNWYERRVTPIPTLLAQRFQMQAGDAITFPSSDSFDIKLEGFVEWSISPEKLAELYVKYGQGGDLIQPLEDNVILPYARSFCRLAGSQFQARDFIDGQKRSEFQEEFARKMREACDPQGIVIRQALVRNIEIPAKIRGPIIERTNSLEEIGKIREQINFQKTEAFRVVQEEIGRQNMAIGDANAKMVALVKTAEQERNTAVTLAQQNLAVAKTLLAASEKEAEAKLSRGKVDAEIVLLNKQAEAEPLRRQITAFGGGDAYARSFFYQNVAPAMKQILTNADGAFGEIFRQFTAPLPTNPPQPQPTR